jgi:DNA polymerase III alpha subunit
MRVTVAGLVLVRQRPGSASGVIFMTIEDETALANIIVWPKVFERFRPVVLGARYVAVAGRMQAEGGVIHVVADRLDDLTALLTGLAEQGTAMEEIARGDEVKRPPDEHRDKRVSAGPQQPARPFAYRNARACRRPRRAGARHESRHREETATLSFQLSSTIKTTYARMARKRSRLVLSSPRNPC